MFFDKKVFVHETRGNEVIAYTGAALVVSKDLWNFLADLDVHLTCQQSKPRHACPSLTVIPLPSNDVLLNNQLTALAHTTPSWSGPYCAIAF